MYVFIHSSIDWLRMNLIRKQGKSAKVKELVIQITEHKKHIWWEGEDLRKAKENIIPEYNQNKFQRKILWLV